MKKSPETILKMKKSAEKRWRKKRAGIVTSLQKVRESALSKIEELFKHWRLSLKETVFVVDAFDWEENDLIVNLQQKIKGAVNVVSKASEYLAKIEVGTILIWCMTEGKVNRRQMLADTDNTSDVVLVEKGEEYIVETYKEWMRRMRIEKEMEGGEREEEEVIEK